MRCCQTVNLSGDAHCNNLNGWGETHDVSENLPTFYSEKVCSAKKNVASVELPDGILQLTCVCGGTGAWMNRDTATRNRLRTTFVYGWLLEMGKYPSPQQRPLAGWGCILQSHNVAKNSQQHMKNTIRNKYLYSVGSRVELTMLCRLHLQIPSETSYESSKEQQQQQNLGSLVTRRNSPVLPGFLILLKNSCCDTTVNTHIVINYYYYCKWAQRMRSTDSSSESDSDGQRKCREGNAIIMWVLGLLWIRILDLIPCQHYAWGRESDHAGLLTVYTGHEHEAHFTGALCFIIHYGSCLTGCPSTSLL